MKPAQRKKISKPAALQRHEPAFREIIGLIQSARRRAFQAVNTELIELYWRVGEYISRKLATAAWGEGVVEELARYIALHHPELKGFTRTSLFRMRQLHDTYRAHPKVAPLVRQLPWSHNLLILGRCKHAEEREFYLRLASGRNWGRRELERQLDGALFERTILSKPKVSPLVTQLHPEAETIFKDTYLLDFLELPETHSERDLQKALVKNLKQFLIELGPDFCFAGEELRLQVGGQDFYLDLLFYHRSLQFLVAFDLKIRKFEPEHLGKMQFYLEAIDRDVRKAHERPSIGVLLCASKDNEVVKYALSHSMSPALIAEYQTRLPDRRLLQRKLHEFYQLALPRTK
ncbi:MAG: PDDEXK nuclease domain-containing protein [Verrucomicrobia bacterium]|jgi:predicted nuclease of restriction endonuclease-like (RecB) superfamily|nr:PDDEXK nuclease domain-containing protein [Verrucomicrobiota bacterium]